MRFFTLVFIVMWSAITAWCLLPNDKLPSISLPKGAQHNTFGELPVVEAMDDGDFYEMDGYEDSLPGYEGCVTTAKTYHKDNKKALRDNLKWCKQFKNKDFDEYIVAGKKYRSSMCFKNGSWFTCGFIGFKEYE